MSEEVKKKFKLPTGKKIIKPIMRFRNGLVEDPDHENYFLFSNSSIDYCLPGDRLGNLVNPFSSEEEKEFLEKKLDIDLNIYKKDGHFIRHRVRLNKEERILNLSNPKDYLDYLVLKANKLYIAPSGEDMMKKATYKFALVDMDFEIKENKTTANTRILAYKIFGKMEDDKEAMLDFLSAYGRRVSPETKENFLVQEIGKIIEEDIHGFIDLMEDKDSFDVKLLISRCLEVGAVIKKGKKYYLPGGDALCGVGESPTMAVVVKYLNTTANQGTLTGLQARVNAAKD